MILILMCIYFLVFFLLPTFRGGKSAGKNTMIFKGDDNAHDLIEFYMKVVIGLCLVAGLEQIQPSFFNFYLFFESPYVGIYGYSLIIISMVWTGVAQWQMSNSWNIGIDQENKTDLHNQDLFRYSRNPIFLGMIGLVLGIFIVRPIFLNLLTFILLVILTTIKVRREDVFLHRQNGPKYTDYNAQTHRWV